jgi:hypothetical protein
MHPETHNSASTGADLSVMLDGQPVVLPAERRSLAAIWAYLEILALEQQRILFSLRVDGARVNLSAVLPIQKKFARVEAETIGLTEVPLQLVRTALLQTAEAKAQVISAVSLVIINDSAYAREIWWNLARALNQPVLTLSLMPENACGAQPAGASLMQLRKWQLEQLAIILKELDEAAWSDDSTALSNALEFRVIPWVQGLETSLELWRDSLMAAAQMAVARQE